MIGIRRNTAATRRDSAGSMTRLIVLSVAIGLAAAACSSPSLGDYAQDVETIVFEMNSRIDAGDAVVDANPTLEQVRANAAERLSARRDFIDQLSSLDPPGEAEDLHFAALDIMTRLTAAEADLAALLDDVSSVAEANALWDTPTGQVARAMDAESLELCAAAQARMDATSQREAVAGLPLIPDELTEVVQVAFRCDSQYR